jgi:hypothetical protein
MRPITALNLLKIFGIRFGPCIGLWWNKGVFSAKSVMV